MNQLNVSLWGDEAFAAILAQKDLWGIITTVAKDTAPPLYYILLHFWMNLFGTAEVAVRSFSIFLYLLLGIVVFLFTKELFNKKAAFFASALIFLNPIIFGYAFEARMYMLLVLLTTCSMWFFKTKRWILYVIATTAALYTHHFALFIFITQGLYYFISQIFYFLKNRRIETKPLIAFIAVVALYLPWIPVFLDQSKRVAADFWLGKPQLRDLRILYEHFIAGSTHQPQERIILLVSIFLLIVRGFSLKKDGFLYLWAIFPPLFTFVMSFIGRPLFFDRYLIVSIPAIPMLLASQNKLNFDNDSLGKKYFSGLTKLLLVGIIIGLVFIDIHVFNHPGKQPFKEVVQYVNSTYGKDKMVINYYTDKLHYFELKYQGANVKIYSANDLPFWTGTALVEPKDIMNTLPKDKEIIIMASGQIEKINVPNYHLVSTQKFKDLYLFQYEKNTIYTKN